MTSASHEAPRTEPRRTYLRASLERGRLQQASSRVLRAGCPVIRAQPLAPAALVSGHVGAPRAPDPVVVSSSGSRRGSGAPEKTSRSGLTVDDRSETAPA